MSTALASSTMSLEEFLAIPETPGIDRELIRGELREYPMTRRGYSHSSIEAQIAFLLGAWRAAQPAPRGVVVSGEAGVNLPGDPPTAVGVDVAYLAPQQRPPVGAVWIDAPPVLAVEVLSPNDVLDHVADKVDQYLAAGVNLVWVVDPHFRTVTVHRSDAAPQMFNTEQSLSGEPFLPGLRVAVSQIFDL